MSVNRYVLLPLVLGLILVSWVTAAEKRPNFLFIITDDQSPETLKCYGNQVCDTPNLDRLAREGMILHDAHHMGSWSGAVCTPSRTMVMTGRTVWHIPGAKGIGPKQDKSFRQEAANDSMPAVFNRAGYDTFRTCKNGNSFNEANALFTVSKTATKRDGTAEGGSPWHGEQVMNYLNEREASKDSDPFLIYFGFSHPHDPRNAMPELAQKYGASNAGATRIDPKAPPLPVNYLPGHPFEIGHPGLRDETQVQGVRTMRDEATIRNEIGREYACIEAIDTQVGRILKKLEAMGELDNTYIFFTSDHGIAVGRHGLTGKQNLYEHTWRVPFIARGPGIKPGSEASGFIYLLDVLPTLCDLAGVKVPEVVEGKSFRPVLEGKQDRMRDVLYGVYCGGTKPGMRSVKTADGWKLIQYDVLDGKVRETQVFNLKENPREFLVEHQAEKVINVTHHQPQSDQVNLAANSAFAAKKKELQQLLQAEMKRLDDPYTLAE